MASTIGVSFHTFRGVRSARVVAILFTTSSVVRLMICSSDAALEVQVRSLLSNYRWLVPADRTVTITMTNDALAVAIVERTTEGK